MTTDLKYNLYMYEENNICYKNSCLTYNNVLLNTGSIIKGQFENAICTTIIDSDIKIITDSNHYLSCPNWGSGYNNVYKIYDNIEKNFNQNVGYSNINQEFENIKCFYFINPFIFSNSGHDLSTMLNYVNYIRNNNITQYCNN